MSKDTLSILGLYRSDDTIFNSMVLPTTISLNRDMLINNLLMECAEFEILYPDPDFMRWAINQWSAKEIDVWNHLYETTQYDYDPISNYDRNESWTDKGHVKVKTTPKSTVTVSENGYENNGMVNTTKSTKGGNDEIENWTDDTKTGRAYGNIGVTTTQEMIRQERDIAEFNMYDIIIQSFKERFCIMIY